MLQCKFEVVAWTVSDFVPPKSQQDTTVGGPMTYPGCLLLWISFCWVWCVFAVAESREGKTVACVGDSITYGSGLPLNAQRNLSYPARLQYYLSQDSERQHWVVRNLGLRGATAMNASRLAYEKSLECKLARETKPDYVVIMLGTNDILANFSISSVKQGYERLLDQFRNLPSKPRLFLLTPPWIDTANVERPRLQSAKEAPYQSAIQEVARKWKLPLLDVHALFVNQPNLFGDGLHPSAHGYDLIALLVYRALVDDATALSNTGSDRSGGKGGAAWLWSSASKKSSASNVDYKPSQTTVDLMAEKTRTMAFYRAKPSTPINPSMRQAQHELFRYNPERIRAEEASRTANIAATASMLGLGDEKKQYDRPSNAKKQKKGKGK